MNQNGQSSIGFQKNLFKPPTQHLPPATFNTHYYQYTRPNRKSVSFAARARSARAANDTTRAQINNIPSKSHVIPLLTILLIIPSFLSSFNTHPAFFQQINMALNDRSHKMCPQIRILSSMKR